MAKNVTLEDLISNVEKAKALVETATAALDAGLGSVEAGHGFSIDGIPYQVVVDKNGKKKVDCMMSKRAIAIQRGLPVPAITRGRPRKDAPLEESKAAE